MLDHAKKSAPAWQRGLIHRPGRLVLVKSVIAAKPIHHFMVTHAPVWVFEEIEQWMRSFFWAGKEKIQRWPVLGNLEISLQTHFAWWSGNPQPSVARFGVESEMGMIETD